MKGINLGNVVLSIFNILILNIFVLPLKLYRNALLTLSKMQDNTPEKEEKTDTELPLYRWVVSVFDTLIVLTYPVGILIAIIGTAYYNAFIVFLTVITYTYFFPFYWGFLKESIILILSIIDSLKKISNQQKDSNP